MRHTRTELHDLFAPHAQQLQDAVFAGCLRAYNSNLSNLLDPSKKALFSHIVRSEAYEYLRLNPLDGFELDSASHPQNQAVVLIHQESGLEARLVKLIGTTPQDTPLPHIDEDPAITPFLFGTDLQFQKPGVVAISWERPTITDEGPSAPIPLTIIRAAPDTRLRQGIADAVIPLSASSTLIPKASFDPNLADSRFMFEEEDTANDE